MLRESDHAYVVVNDKMNRSMKEFIASQARVGPDHCRLNQIIDLDPDALCQVWHDGLPIQTLESLKTSAINVVIDCAAVSVSAQIIATQTRDANLEGLTLQRAHERMGEFLADKLVDEFGRTCLLKLFRFLMSKVVHSQVYAPATLSFCLS